MKKITVFVVDDSAVVRQVMGQILAREPDIELIGSAADPIFAMDKLKQQWPDVILMDVEMPRMDGLSFLRKIMAEHPTPVVMCSSLTTKGAQTTIEALAAGAVDVIAKPTLGVKDFLQESAAALVGAIRTAATARVSKLVHKTQDKVAPKLSADVMLSEVTGAMAETTDRLIAIGTSTGGTVALEVVLSALPRTCPGIVVVQHMPEKFTAAFAERLNTVCEIEVREGQSGDRIIPGRAIIAPGGKHMMVKRNGAQYVVEVAPGPPVNRHCPSVDVLFRSVAKFAGKNAVGVIMTGMGDDGARGLKEMHQVGAHTIAQDEASCVVFGMPKEAIKLGAADEVVPLDAIARLIAR